MIDRKDMLELTRRMTPTRTCMRRIAGAYFDRDGEIDNTFNIRFLNLNPTDKAKHLAIAKTVPFAKTNEQLIEHVFPKESKGKGSIWQLLQGVHSCGLENDLLMEVLYEQIGKYYSAAGPYAAAVFHGTYDVPMKSSDNGYLYESEEVYDFIICTISPQGEDYEIGKPDYGFLFPAFSFRSGDPGRIDIFNRLPEYPQKALTDVILGRDR